MAGSLVGSSPQPVGSNAISVQRVSELNSIAGLPACVPENCLAGGETSTYTATTCVRCEVFL